MLQQEIQTENIITSGGFKETEFKIKNKEFIFDVLSDKIYTNKIGAIIREIISNAVDANIESKSKKKIKIHIPTGNEPYLSIRDFGPGMNSDRIKVFVSFGDSTKRDSAEQIGYFGMGSKSPFAYTDSFYITTWVGGHKNEYMAYIGDDRKRALMLLNRTKSDEPNGTEVKINIKKHEDSNFFKCEFLNIWGHSLHLFDAENIYDSELETYYNSILNNCHNRKDIYFGRFEFNSYSSFSVMNGNIKYQLDKSIVRDLNKYHKMTETLSSFHFLENNNIVIKFKIGELKLSVSRESIEICENNARIIETKVRGLVDEIRESITDKWNSCNTDVVKIRYFLKTYAKFNLIGTPSFDFKDTIVEYIKTDTDITKSKEVYNFNILNSKYYFYHVVGDIDKIEGRARRFFALNSDSNKLSIIKFFASSSLINFEKLYPFITLVHIRTLTPIPRKNNARQTKDIRLMKAIKDLKIGLYDGKAGIEKIHPQHFENEKNNKKTQKYYTTLSFNKINYEPKYFDGKDSNYIEFYVNYNIKIALSAILNQKPKIFSFASTYKSMIPSDWIPTEKMLIDLVENSDISNVEYRKIFRFYFEKLNIGIDLPESISKIFYDRFFKIYGRSKITRHNFDYDRIYRLLIKNNDKLRNRLAKDVKRVKAEYRKIAMSFPGMFLDSYNNKFLGKLKNQAIRSAIKYIKETVK